MYNKGMDGKLIVFEGPDGSGKTTVLDRVYKKLSKDGYHIYKFREPGGTEISEKIRNIILDNNNLEMSYRCEALLYASSRAQLVDQKIRPLLNDGAIILCDRFVLSSMLYQGIGRGLGIEEVKSINDFAIGDISADLTLFLNIDYKTALNRKRKNFVTDRLENEAYSFHKKTYDGYIKLSKMYEDEIVSIDANEDLDTVVNSCLEIINNYLKEI